MRVSLLRNHHNFCKLNFLCVCRSYASLTLSVVAVIAFAGPVLNVSKRKMIPVLSVWKVTSPLSMTNGCSARLTSSMFDVCTKAMGVDGSVN